jgi:hypothetical protein
VLKVPRNTALPAELDVSLVERVYILFTLTIFLHLSDIMDEANAVLDANWNCDLNLGTLVLKLNCLVASRSNDSAAIF